MVPWEGFAYAACAALGHSGIDATRKLASQRKLSSIELVALVGLFDALFLSLLVYLTSPASATPLGLHFALDPRILLLTPRLLSILAISAGLKVLCGLMYQRALYVSPLSVTVPYLAFTPALLIFTSYVLIGEVPSSQGLSGVVIVTAGGYLLALESGRIHHRKEKEKDSLSSSPTMLPVILPNPNPNAVVSLNLPPLNGILHPIHTNPDSNPNPNPTPGGKGQESIQRDASMRQLSVVETAPCGSFLAPSPPHTPSSPSSSSETGGDGQSEAGIEFPEGSDGWVSPAQMPQGSGFRANGIVAGVQGSAPTSPQKRPSLSGKGQKKVASLRLVIPEAVLTSGDDMSTSRKRTRLWGVQGFAWLMDRPLDAIRWTVANLRKGPGSRLRGAIWHHLARAGEPLLALRREEGSGLMLGCAAILSLTNSFDKMGAHVSPSVLVFACFQRIAMAIPSVTFLALTSPKSFYGLFRFFPVLASISFFEIVAIVCYLKSLDSLLVSYSVATKRTNILISVMVGKLLFKEKILRKLPYICLMMAGMLLIVFA